MCGCLDEGEGTEIVTVIDRDASPPREATFAISRFVLVGCALSSPGSSAAELEVIENELLGAPIDPDLVRTAGNVSGALAAIAINASNFACVRLNTIWKDEGRADAQQCAVLTVT